MPRVGSNDEKGFATLLVASGIVVTIDEIQRGKLEPSRYFGLVAAFLMLSVVSQFQPGLARGFAWLLLLALLLTRGPRVLDSISRKAKEVRK